MGNNVKHGKNGKHTPGPWRLEKMRAPNGGMYYRVFPAGDDNATVCVAQVIHDGHCAYHDNALIIAAAPELLAALVAMVERAEWYGDNDAANLCDARAAIAKAKGEA